MNANSTASGWYYSKRGGPAGHQTGPLTWTQLLSLGQTGQLGPDDLVWNPQVPDWLPAAQFPELFAPAAQPAAQSPYPAPGPAGAAYGQATQAAAAPVSVAHHDVFISYSAEDKPTADAVCATLEAKHIRCWIAPRDVLPGRGYAAMLIEAINDARLMVLVFSSNSNDSSHVMREVERAASKGIPILPLRIEDVPPSASMEYFISSTHWLDALTPPLQRHLQKLADTVKLLLARTDRTATVTEELGARLSVPAVEAPTEAAMAKAPPPKGAAKSAKPWYRRSLPLLGLGAGALAVVAAIVVVTLLSSSRDGDSKSATTSQVAAVTTTTSITTALNTWTKLNPAGDLPSERSYHSMVYDSTSRRVILFGGGTLNGGFNDTWAYDPTTSTWTDLHPAGDVPSARMGFRMVYDSSTGEVILFGGFDGVYTNDTWAYDSTANTWTDLRPTGDVPSGRSAHSMVYASSTGRVILFGGSDGGIPSNDTWAYDPTANTWTDLHPAGGLPSARSDHSMVYDSSIGKVILFGGLGGTVFDDTWAYDPAANTWTNLNATGPSARCFSSVVYDSSTSKVILFGGFDGVDKDDTWAYDPTADTWTDLRPAGDVPPAREDHSMVYDPDTGKVILFGGGTSGSYFNDTWAFQGG